MRVERVPFSGCACTPFLSQRMEFCPAFHDVLGIPWSYLADRPMPGETEAWGEQMGGWASPLLGAAGCG